MYRKIVINNEGDETLRESALVFLATYERKHLATNEQIANVNLNGEIYKLDDWLFWICHTKTAIRIRIIKDELA